VDCQTLFDARCLPSQATETESAADALASQRRIEAFLQEQHAEAAWWDRSDQQEATWGVFLKYPTVPLDTKHLEREIRAVAMGCKARFFCWTELGDRYVEIGQSLLAAYRLQGVAPSVDVVDLRQRMDIHPACDAQLLTPRLCKQLFAANPLRSDLDRLRQ
jgi:hypothetical protein